MMQAAIADFLDAMRYDRGFTPETCAAYGADLRALLSFLQKTRRPQPTSWAQVSFEDLVAFLSDLRTREYAEASLRRHAAAFRTFFAWLLEESRIPFTPTEALQVAKAPKRLPRSLDETTLNHLIEAVNGSSPEDLRDRAILELLYGCGLRCSELLRLNLHDIDFSGALVRVYGKGRKERTVPFGPSAARAVKAYLPLRDHFARTYRKGALAADLLRPAAPLFLSPTGRRCTRTLIAAVVRRRIDTFLPPGAKATPHTLRHAFATHLLNHGAPLLDIRDLLGHASISTTQIYTHVANDRLRETFQRCFPRSGSDAAPHA